MGDANSSKRTKNKSSGSPGVAPQIGLFGDLVFFGSFRLPQMTRRNLYLAHSVVICKQSRGPKQNGSSGVSNARMEAWLREEVVLGHMFKCTKLRDTSSRAQLVLLTRRPVHRSQGGRELMPALFSNREARQHHIWQAAPCMH